jgi:hypothetical protein
MSEDDIDMKAQLSPLDIFSYLDFLRFLLLPRNDQAGGVKIPFTE